MKSHSLPPLLEPHTSKLRFQGLPACHLQSTEVDDNFINLRFSHDYNTARERFLSLSRCAGATITSHTLSERGPMGEELAIDFAEVGSTRTAKSVVVVISGVHGSEGRVGSAIQLDILAAKPILPPDSALILVHALNPFGMTYERRTTKDNVDLNRNFTTHFNSDPVANCEALHHLTPTTPQELEDAVEFLASLDEPTRSRYLQVLSPGQYTNPQAPFYGGSKREENNQILLSFLESRLAAAQRVLFVDIHTGLGNSSENTLFSLGRNDRMLSEIAAALSPRFEIRQPEKTIPYFSKVHGSIAGGLAAIFSDNGAASLVHEIGTYPDALLPVLCLENFCANYPHPTLTQTAFNLSREFFCPSSNEWRRAALQHGTEVLTRAAGVTLAAPDGAKIMVQSTAISGVP